jgi:YVTN family beta-propeller protein
MTKAKWLLVWCAILLQMMLLGQKVEAQATTNCEAVLAKGSQPAIVAYDAANTLGWVSLFQLNEVVAVQPGSCAIVRNVGTGTNPYGVVFLNPYIWVSNNGSNTVTKILSYNGQVAATVNVGFQPRGIATDGTNIWVANYGSNTVTKINGTTNAIVGSFATGSGPYVPAIANDGSVWIPNRNSHSLTVLANSGSLKFTLQTDGEPQFVAFDGTNMWVSCYSAGTVEEFSLGGTLLRRVNPTASGQVGGPTGIAWDPGDALIWGASNSGYVYSIDQNGIVGNITNRGGSGNAHIGVAWSGFSGGAFWTTDTGAGIIELLNP